MARRALILANGTFTDAKIAPLASPVADAKRLCDLLKRADVGGYDVTLCADADFATVRIRIQKFFASATYDDMNLILISGHGIKDPKGKLHFATSDTQVNLLRATSLASRFILESMEESAASQQILFIDTCYSGAFARGTVNKAAMASVSRDDFGDVEARGTAIITAATSVQLAGEAKVDGTMQSVFTRHLIKGIETGAADSAGTGQIRLSDLFEYVRASVKRDAPSQTPQPYYNGLDGASVVVAINPAPRAVELSDDLRAQIASKDRTIRGAAIDDLYSLVAGGGSARIKALEALRKLENDDSLFVRGLAKEAIEQLGLAAKPTDEIPQRPKAEIEAEQNILKEKQANKRKEALDSINKFNENAKNNGPWDKDKTLKPLDLDQTIFKSVLSDTAMMNFILIFGILLIITVAIFSQTPKAGDSTNAGDAMAIEAVAGAENAADASMDAMGNVTDPMAAGADAMANVADAMEGTSNDAMTNVDGAVGAVDAAADAMKK